MISRATTALLLNSKSLNGESGNPHQFQGRSLFYSTAIGTDPEFADVIIEQAVSFDPQRQELESTSKFVHSQLPSVLICQWKGRLFSINWSNSEHSRKGAKANGFLHRIVVIRKNDGTLSWTCSGLAADKLSALKKVHGWMQSLKLALRVDVTNKEEMVEAVAELINGEFLLHDPARSFLKCGNLIKKSGRTGRMIEYRFFPVLRCATLCK